jgi:hypothetical protein
VTRKEERKISELEEGTREERKKRKILQCARNSKRLLNIGRNAKDHIDTRDEG